MICHGRFAAGTGTSIMPMLVGGKSDTVSKFFAMVCRLETGLQVLRTLDKFAREPSLESILQLRQMPRNSLLH